MTELRKTYITDETSGRTMTVDDNNHGDVVQHSHPNTVYLHIDLDITGGTVQDFILVDLSDTTNYPHVNTNYIHLEYLALLVDAEANADYEIQIGFLENVDGTDGDFYEIFHVTGSKTLGQQKDITRTWNPSGPRCRSESMVTSHIEANDTSFQTDVNLASTLDPTTADTPSGNGDLVVRITSSAVGVNPDFTAQIDLAYHTH